jgi:alpha-methylacyl-CoA racemase
MPTGLLDGVTVLDLSSVGPAARTSRWLADYGARVVKVGPPAKHGAAQITPPFYAYAGHRGMQRVLLDLKTPAGIAAFLRLAATADVVIESFRPASSTASALVGIVSARNPRSCTARRAD